MMIYVSDRPMGRNIRYLRQKQYISCAKLARLTGIPYGALHLIERGILRDIHHDQLKSLCAVLHTDQEHLLARDLKM